MPRQCSLTTHSDKKLTIFLSTLLILEAIMKIIFIAIGLRDVDSECAVFKSFHRTNTRFVVVVVGLASNLTSCSGTNVLPTYLYITDWCVLAAMSIWF